MIMTMTPKWQWRQNLPTWRHRHFFFFFFWRFFVIGRSFISISALVFELWQFFYKKFRNPEIGNTSVWVLPNIISLVLPNIWRLGQVRNSKFVSIEMLLNVAKCQGYNFTVSELLKEKTNSTKLTPPPLLTRILHFMILCVIWCHL